MQIGTVIPYVYDSNGFNPKFIIVCMFHTFMYNRCMLTMFSTGLMGVRSVSLCSVLPTRMDMGIENCGNKPVTVLCGVAPTGTLPVLTLTPCVIGGCGIVQRSAYTLSITLHRGTGITEPVCQSGRLGLSHGILRNFIAVYSMRVSAVLCKSERYAMVLTTTPNITVCVPNLMNLHWLYTAVLSLEPVQPQRVNTIVTLTYAVIL